MSCGLNATSTLERKKQTKYSTISCCGLCLNYVKIARHLNYIPDPKKALVKLSQEVSIPKIFSHGKIGKDFLKITEYFNRLLSSFKFTLQLIKRRE